MAREIVATDGHFLRAHNFDAYDELEALDKAQGFVDGHDVELWKGETLVKRFETKRTSGRGKD